jgi:hypothetical protein
VALRFVKGNHITINKGYLHPFNLGHGVMVLALLSKRVNMVNVVHGVMELALMSKKSQYGHYDKWQIQYGSIQVTDGGINKTRFMSQQNYVVHPLRYHEKLYNRTFSSFMPTSLPSTETMNTKMAQIVSLDHCVSAIVTIATSKL